MNKIKKITSAFLVSAIISACFSGLTVMAASSSLSKVDGVYVINNADDLNKFASDVDGGAAYVGETVVLTADIVANSDFHMIGDYGAFQNDYFEGTFDGQNHSITANITSDENFVGLFSCVEDAIIKNLTFNGSVKGDNKTSYQDNATGGIVAYVNGESTFINCTNNASVTGFGKEKPSVGGIAGYAYASTFDNCVNTGSITPQETGGGIVGIAKLIKNCKNYGIISGTYDLGGIVGGLYNSETAYTDGIIIENCINTGIVSGSTDVGGIIGYTDKRDEIANCVNTGNITAVKRVGGIAGYAGTDAYSNSLTEINFSYNTGTIKGDAYAGGICGYNIKFQMDNCYNLGYVYSKNEYGGGLLGNCSWRDDVPGMDPTPCTQVFKSYYIKDKTFINDSVTTPTNQGVYNGYLENDGAYCKTEEQFKSGEVAYLLNQDIPDGTQAFYQNLSENGDTAPVLTSTGENTVYKVKKYEDCSLQVSYDDAYSNKNETIFINGGHKYDENGICTICHIYEKPALTEDGVYLISNAGNLKYFADMVNNENNAGIKARLTADINLSSICHSADTVNSVAEVNWTPIGTVDCPYTGSFDGDGHIISGIYINTNSDNQGLFGTLSGGAIIENITIGKNCTVIGGNYTAPLAGFIAGTGTITIENCVNNAAATGDNYTAGLIGGNNNNADTIIYVNFTKCMNYATVTGSKNCGGIYGVNMNNSAKISMTNCGNVGEIKATDESGGLSGGLGSDASLTNCWNLGAVSGTNSDGFARLDSGYNIKNCYMLKGLTTSYNLNVIQGTNRQFMNGEITYKLNDGITDGTQAFYQTLNNDAYPSLSGKTVYCDKSATIIKYCNVTVTAPVIISFGGAYAVIESPIETQKTLIFASYNSSGKLINIDIQENSSLLSGKNKYYPTLDFTSQGASKIIAMLWEDLKSGVPVCHTVSATITAE